MMRDGAHPLLFTPGPVSVSQTTKDLMMIDRPSGDIEFQTDVCQTRDYLVRLVNGQGIYTAIPVPGSATYANEGVIATLVPAGGKVLLHTNGVYGDRLVDICAANGTAHAVLRTPPFSPATQEAFEAPCVPTQRSPTSWSCTVRRAPACSTRSSPSPISAGVTRKGC